MTACNSSSTSSDDQQVEEGKKYSSFKVGDASFECEVSTQYFGSNKETDNFSVLCQQDEPFALLQATFANESDAKSGHELKVKGGSYKVNSGEFDLELSGMGSDKLFKADSSSTGSLRVEGNKLIISNFKLFDSDKSEKIVSAEIGF